jgi:hypothetical protein
MNLTRAVDLLSLNRPAALTDMVDAVMTARAKIDTVPKGSPMRPLYQRWAVRAERRVAKYANTVIWAAAVDPMTLRAYLHCAMLDIDREAAKVHRRVKREDAAAARAAAQI